ncbi:MAG: hypothetical protein HZB40_16680 [Rhodocyclales bacterium]|nr:hypothetical protein [Rhodocyclales bacterium]
MQSLDYRIAQVEHEIRTLSGELATACAQTDDPSDPKLIELDRRLDETKATLRRLRSIQEHQIVGSTAKQRETDKQERAEAFQRASEFAAARVAIGKKLDAQLAGIGKLLAEWEAVGVECRKAAGAVHRPTADNFDYFMLDVATGRSGSLVVAFDMALRCAGIGLVGIPFNGTAPPSKVSTTNMADAAALAHTRLQALMDGHLRTWGDVQEGSAQ